jgi:hypothetical protein
MSPDQVSDAQAQVALVGFLATWLVFLIGAFWWQHRRAKRERREWNYRQELLRRNIKRAP